MKLKGIVSIIAVLLTVALIGFKLVANKQVLDEKKQPIDRSHIAIKVTADVASLHTFDGTFAQPATLTVKDEATIATETSGKILTLNINLGSTVSKGQVIGRIDVTETQQRLAAVELAIEKLTRDYDRNKVLVEGNAMNANALLDSKYELDNKKLEAAQLRTQIAKAEIVAPLSGIITTKSKVAGEFVGTGTAVATITSMQTLVANVYVPESQIFEIKERQTVPVSTSLQPDRKINSTVTYISPKGDNNHNYLVELTIQNPAGLKAGLYVMAHFTNAAAKGSLLMIPKAALAEGVKNPVVYVVKDGVAEERMLVTGIESGDFIEVKSGLSAGENVVTSGQINLINGSRVELVATTN